MTRASILVALALMTFLQINVDAAIIVTATYRGGARVDAGPRFHNTSSPDQFSEYLARTTSYKYNNFFLFNTRSYRNIWVQSAYLKLRQGVTSNSSPKTLTLRDFNYNSRNNPINAFNDAGSGVSYGATTWSGNTSSGRYIDFGLNGAAVAQITNNMLGYHMHNLDTQWFGVGGELTGYNGVFAFSGTRSSTDARLFMNVISNRGPTAVSENISAKLEDGATLNGSGSYDLDAGYGDGISLYEWDIDNDGTFDFQHTSSSLTLNNSQLTSYGVSVGDNTIGLRVTDLWGSTNTSTSNLHINPVPEPATIAVWSILGLCGIGYGVRRKIKRAA